MYRVKQGRSLVGPDGTLYRGGSGLPDTWEKSIYRTLLKEPQPPIEQATVELDDDLVIPNNAPTNPALPGKESDSREGAINQNKATRITESSSLPQPPVASVSAGKHHPSMTATKKVVDPHTPAGKWNLNPVNLRKMTLEGLNIKAAEIDPNIEAFKDTDEAVAFMSQDFKD